jgi:hypothetical protein
LHTAPGSAGGVHPCTSNVPQRSHSNQPLPGRFPSIHRMIRVQYGHGVSGIGGWAGESCVVSVVIHQAPAPTRAVRMPFTKPSRDGAIVRARKRWRWIPAILPALLLLSACRGEEPPPRPAGRITGWHKVATFSGRGNAQLETFPIESWTWRVQWETRNETPAGAGTFKVTAHSGDSGRLLAEIADVRGVDHDTTYVTELPHRYYLVVKSAGVDWTMVVEEAELK